MIEQIGIKNFKSHEDTVINLHEGFNAIYGNPQAGKSNIMRAIDLLKSNRPIGAKFMPKWAKKEIETEVYILDDEGVKIGIKVHCKRPKSGKPKRESTYYYIEDTATGDKWDATGVGKEVPDEITKALQLTDINIQAQADPPFLATDSGSKISKTVNKITGLDIGDQLFSSLGKKYNEQKAIVKNIKADLAEQNENIKNFPNAKDLEAWMKRLETVLTLIDKNDDRISSLKNYIFKLNDLSQVANVPDLRNEFFRLNKELIPWIYDGAEKINKLRTWKSKIESLQQIKEVPDLGLPFGRASILNSNINKARKKIRALKTAISLKADFITAKEARDSAGDEYISFLLELKKCPTCFQSIDKEKIKEIIRGI